MSELKWPHQTVPRALNSIVDEQVKRWLLAQEEARADAAKEAARQARALAGARAPERADRLGFHYWGDAIVAELSRLMHEDVSCEAFLNAGIAEPRSMPAGTATPCQPLPHRLHRRRWLHRAPRRT